MYDIVWVVYNQIDDYCTLSNFWVLDKHFYTFYMKQNAAYQHKFRVLFNQLFTFLSLLPNSQLLDTDVEFFSTVSCRYLRPYQQRDLRHAIAFMYTLFKNFLNNELINYHQTDYMRKRAPLIAGICLIQGPHFLDRYCQLYFNKQCVRIEAKNKHRSPVINLRYLMGFSRSDTYRYLDNQLQLFESVFIQ